MNMVCNYWLETHDILRFLIQDQSMEDDGKMHEKTEKT